MIFSLGVLYATISNFAFGDNVSPLGKIMISVSGGIACKNPLFVQLLSDVCQKEMAVSASRQYAVYQKLSELYMEIGGCLLE